MNILTVDTVLNKTYIALLFNQEETFKEIKSDENYHSAYLMNVLNDMFSKKDISDIDYFGVNLGVGSFTGIRTGLSVVKVFANRLNKKIVPYTTFDVLQKAYNTKNIILDARRGSAFCLQNNEIEMKPYEDVKKIISDKEYISDNSLKERLNLPNLISYEEKEINLAPYELEIVKEKIKNNEFNDYYEIKPVYVQTPPIFMKN